MTQLLACDDYGRVYSIAPDGSYSADYQCPTDIPGVGHAKVTQTPHSWDVLNDIGMVLGSFRTRQDARNFIKHYS